MAAWFWQKLPYELFKSIDIRSLIFRYKSDSQPWSIWMYSNCWPRGALRIANLFGKTNLDFKTYIAVNGMDK